MLAIKGFYKEGKVILKEKVETRKPVDIIVTFLEDIEEPVLKKIDLNIFSFNKSRDLLKNYKGSLSDIIIEERRSAI